MAPSTQVLQCDPASISFPSSLESSAPPFILSTNTLDALKLAVHHLVTLDDVVVFPTETVYGLGANALSASAVSRIFTTKGRPQDNPLIVHVSSLAMLQRILPKDYTISPTYRALISAFWPGALTLLFPVNPSIVPQNVTAGHPTVAVRMPSHPVARALIALCDTPLAAPSANASGKPSPTRAAHVQRDLGTKVSVILDAGACAIGLESTVVDGLGPDGDVRVLRPGGVTVEDLERVLGGVNIGTERMPRVLVHRRDYEDLVVESAPTTPGMKYRHYSPAVPVILVMTSSKVQAINLYSGPTELLKKILEKYCQGDSSPKVGLLAPSDSPLFQQLASINPAIQHFALGPQAEPAVSAARLFDGLITLERDGVNVIVVEEIPEEREGLAFMNRARKAASELWYLR